MIIGKVTKDMIKDHIDELYVNLYDDNQLKWMPKKQVYNLLEFMTKDNIF